ncbi:flagellar biosynthesis anti-sigma factor FlgM [uncultured Tyzzerella sp.]|uniref:flagellar biosynthesis anti-sigma factor FlgM n=1 Tax=uncultured Tyzzerella sp. TaxID=2321398 RepID=UPI0029433B31|nr:flagellar biosynthesis anti-sigma factor FlgM [uncultured Tyzzerella sp.]
MKITNLFNTTNVYSKSKIKDKKLETTKKANDSFVVSDKARDFQTVLKAVSNTPDLREEKVNSIIKKMEQGNYNVSAEDIANKLLK